MDTNIKPNDQNPDGGDEMQLLRRNLDRVLFVGGMSLIALILAATLVGGWWILWAPLGIGAAALVATLMPDVV
jgi:riboflavin biosynthesis pyrimidine reductase